MAHLVANEIRTRYGIDYEELLAFFKRFDLLLLVLEKSLSWDGFLIKQVSCWIFNSDIGSSLSSARFV